MCSWTTNLSNSPTSISRQIDQKTPQTNPWIHTTATRPFSNEITQIIHENLQYQHCSIKISRKHKRIKQHITSACIPACLLTPVASYITMRLNPKQTGKSESATPWHSATDVVSAVHSAVCDDGIPPEANIILKSHFLSTKKFNTTFTDCATTHAKTPETKVEFAASVAKKGLNRTFALVVKLSSATPNAPFW